MTPSRLLLPLLVVLLPVAGAFADKQPRRDPAGDPLPAGAIQRIGSSRLRHTAMVIGLDWSRDGKILASCGWDNLVRLWDPATGRQIRTLSGASGALYRVVLSPDARHAAASGGGQDIHVWEVATGKRLHTLTAPVIQGRLAWSPDGKILASAGSNGQVHLWNPLTGKRNGTISVGQFSIPCVDFSPDSKRLLICGSDSAVRVWEVAGNKELLRAVLPGQPSDAVFSRDGKKVAVNCSTAVLILDGDTLKQQRQIPTQRNWPVLFSPDGKTLAVGSSQAVINLYEVDTGKLIRTLAGHAQGVPRLAFRPDGKVLASASHDTTVKLWDVAGGQELPHSSSLPATITTAVLSRDGRYFLAGARNVVRAWDVASGKPVQSVTVAPTDRLSLAVAADGKSFFTASSSERTIARWDLSTGKQLRTYSSRGFVVGLHADGKSLAAVSPSVGLTVFEVEKGDEARHTPFSGRGTSFVFSPDGRRLAGLEYNRLHLVDAETGNALGTVSDGYATVTAWAFSPDGRCLALAMSDRTVRVAEVWTRQIRCRLSGLTASANALAFAPDGRHLIAASSSRDFHLWDLATRKEIKHETGHDGPVRTLALAPEAGLLATVGNDSVCLIWKLSELIPPAAIPKVEGQDRLQSAWADLNRQALDAESASWALAGAGDAGVKFLAEQLARVAPEIDVKRVEKLIADLDHRRFQVREQASKELEALAERIESHLRKALAGNPPPETQRRLRAILDKLDPQKRVPLKLRELRAVEALERLGSAEARRLLTRLANDAGGGEIADEAKAALQRLQGRK